MYPSQTAPERYVDGAVHAVSLIGFLIAGAFLLPLAAAAGDIAPSRIIEGVSTELETPWGIDAPQIDDLVFADGFESGGTTEWTQTASGL